VCVEFREIGLKIDQSREQARDGLSYNFIFLFYDFHAPKTISSLHIKGYSFRILMGIPGTHWTGHPSLAALFAHNGQEWAIREGAYSN